MTTNPIVPYTLPQTVFALSMASNALFNLKESHSELQKSIEAFLGTAKTGQGTFFQLMNKANPAYPCLANASGAAGVDGDWRTVWGPVVFQALLNEGATNMMLVAHSPSMNVYVVGIAGTNPTGLNALLYQDLDVYPAHMVAWPPKGAHHWPFTPKLEWTPSPNPSPTTPAIAKGTSEGVSRLFRLLDPHSQLELHHYLDTVATPDATLIFTGHSLGGALAPMLALALYPEPPQSPNPKAKSWKQVLTLPTAGPTPGTQAIADLFAKAYPVTPTNATSTAAVQIPSWNSVYANTYDVVPRAWDALAGLVKIPADPFKDYWPSFFAGGAGLAPALGAETKLLIDSMLQRGGYQGATTPYYVPAMPHTDFTGTWGNWDWAPPPPNVTGPFAYPVPWSGETVPLQISAFGELFNYILDAHLSQYAKAFLGYPIPRNPPVMP